MTAPTKRSEQHSTANGTDQVTTTALTVASGDLITLKLKHVDATVVPAFVVRNNSASSMITEDETIAAATDGFIVYKDGVSVNRTSGGAVTNGTTVPCLGAVANDVGRRIAGGIIPAHTYVTSVSAGVSYTISQTMSGTLSAGTSLTLNSDIAYDYSIGDSTNGVVYFWSVKQTGGSSTSFSAKINWGAASGARRWVTKSNTPAASQSVPLRASRIANTYGTTGGASGTGVYPCARQSGSTLFYGCVAEFAFATGGSNSTSTALIIDFDNSGGGGGSGYETTQSAGNGGGRVYLYSNNGSAFADGYWDGTEGTLPASTVQCSFGSNPGAAKTLAGVVYAMQIAPHRVALPVITETDASQTIGHRKTLAVPTVTEADAAVPFSHLGQNKFIALPVVGETDNTVALVARKSRSIATVTETDTVPAFIRVHLFPTVTETDTAVTIVGEKTWRAEVSFTDKKPEDRIDGASAVVYKTEDADSGDIRLILKKGGVAVQATAWTTLTTTPTVLALTLAPPVIGYTGITIEWEARSSSLLEAVVESAEIFYTVGVGIVTETETAQPIGHTKRKALPSVTETDGAFQIVRGIRVFINDTAGIIGQLAQAVHESRGFNDTVGVSATTHTHEAETRQLNDTVSISASILTGRISQRLFSETVGLPEFMLVNSHKVLVLDAFGNAVQISATVHTRQHVVLGTTDTVGIVSTFSLRNPTGALPPDAVGITATAGKVGGQAYGFSDAVGIAGVGVRRPYVRIRIVPNTVGLSSTINIGGLLSVTVHDLVGLTAIVHARRPLSTVFVKTPTKAEIYPSQNMIDVDSGLPVGQGAGHNNFSIGWPQ